jgi:sulfhydrogenase subunit beta (sulfur reductase)
MNLKVMPKSALAGWVELLREQHRVIGPKESGDHHVFGEIDSASELDLAYASTILPPKKALLPQQEKLFSFQDNGRSLDLHLDDRPTVILGIHTCDLRAVMLLDQALSKGIADQHYWARRRPMTFVSIECLKPCSENSFCRDMGTFTVPEEFDLHLTDLGEQYAVQVGSEKGETLLAGLNALRPAVDADYQRFGEVMGAKWPRFPYRLEADMSELPSLLAVGYRSALWDQIGERCLACGSCTMVCPTCYCFDVHDEVDFSLTSGVRLRVWDSCQLSDFAEVAGGHDFRAQQAARLRHRLSHKFRYQVEMMGQASCVGCGRCSDACIAGINLVDVLNNLRRKCLAITSRRREVAL